MPELRKTRALAYMSGMPFATPEPRGPQAHPVRVDDTLLVREAQQGNTASFEELVRHYDRAVLRLAIHLTNSQEDAQDIYQEAFLRAYQNLGRFRFECSFYTWLYRIVTNLCLDHLRKRQYRTRDLVTTITPDGEQENVLDRMADARPSASPERAAATMKGNSSGSTMCRSVFARPRRNTSAISR